MTQTNCHNCGAPITGPECEYCGTRFNIRVVEPEINNVELKLEMSQTAINQALVGLLSANEIRRRIGFGEI